jgi:hypothetical protein
VSEDSPAICGGGTSASSRRDWITRAFTYLKNGILKGEISCTRIC